MDIKILGTGCPKCKTLEKRVRDVVSELGVEAEIEKVSDVAKIMQYDVLMTPGLVLNGQVRVSGRLPGPDEIRELIEAER